MSDQDPAKSHRPLKTRLLNFAAYAGGAALALLALELILRLLPVPMGVYRTEDYQRWPLVNNEPNREYAYSMSWSF
jgi:hypothetical protein